MISASEHRPKTFLGFAPLVIVTYTGTKAELMAAGVAKSHMFPRAPKRKRRHYQRWVIERKRGGLFELRIWREDRSAAQLEHQLLEQSPTIRRIEPERQAILTDLTNAALSLQCTKKLYARCRKTIDPLASSLIERRAQRLAGDIARKHNVAYAGSWIDLLVSAQMP